MFDTGRERSNRSLNQKQGKMSLVDWKNARRASNPREASGRAHPYIYASGLGQLQPPALVACARHRKLRPLPGLGANVAEAGSCDTGETSRAGPRTTCSVGREYSSETKQRQLRRKPRLRAGRPGAEREGTNTRQQPFEVFRQLGGEHMRERIPRGFVFFEKVFLSSCSNDRDTCTFVLLPECPDV